MNSSWLEQSQTLIVFERVRRPRFEVRAVLKVQDFVGVPIVAVVVVDVALVVVAARGAFDCAVIATVSCFLLSAPLSSNFVVVLVSKCCF